MVLRKIGEQVGGSNCQLKPGDEWVVILYQLRPALEALHRERDIVFCIVGGNV